jgi:ATP-dependent Clp protease ATP-binding subunit ClpA
MLWSSLVSSLRLVARRFTDRSIQVVDAAREEAAKRGHPTVTAEHVLLALALVRPGPGRVAMEKLGLDLAKEREVIAALLAPQPNDATNEAPAIASLEEIVDEAVVQARKLRHDYVGTEHVTLALLAVEASRAGQFLREHGINAVQLRDAVLAVLSGS